MGERIYLDDPAAPTVTPFSASSRAMSAGATIVMGRTFGSVLRPGPRKNLAITEICVDEIRGRSPGT
jgi:hypothetical protein